MVTKDKPWYYFKDYNTIKEFDEIGFISISKLIEKLNKDFECKFIRVEIKKY